MSDSVVVLAPNWLGDAVMALPAIADVKRHVSPARVTVAARPPVAPLFRLSPAVDDVVVLQWRGRLLQPGPRTDARAIAASAARIAILLPNSFASAWLVFRSGVRERWGYGTDMRGLLLTRTVARPETSVHQGRYYQHLTSSLGFPPGALEPVLVVPPQALDAARSLLVARGWDGVRPLAVIAPGAAYGTAKQWLPDHFVALTRRLVEERGAFCALVGSHADAPATAHIAAGVPRDARPFVADIAGATTLEALAGALRLARVAISNDSGAMHLAGAVGVPVAALFGPTREYETAPLAARGGRTDVLINPVACRPCMLRECPIDHRCMAGLAPDRVFGAVTALMGEA